MSSILPKNEQKQINLRYHSIVSPFFVRFSEEFRIHTNKSFRNYLTFTVYMQSTRGNPSLNSLYCGSSPMSGQRCCILVVSYNWDTSYKCFKVAYSCQTEGLRQEKALSWLQCPLTKSCGGVFLRNRINIQTDLDQLGTLQMFTGNYGNPAQKICNIYGKGL